MITSTLDNKVPNANKSINKFFSFLRQHLKLGLRNYFLKYVRIKIQLI